MRRWTIWARWAGIGVAGPCGPVPVLLPSAVLYAEASARFAK